jgi:hypothetical protein
LITLTPPVEVMAKLGEPLRTPPTSLVSVPLLNSQARQHPLQLIVPALSSVRPRIGLPVLVLTFNIAPAEMNVRPLPLIVPFDQLRVPVIVTSPEPVKVPPLIVAVLKVNDDGP